jgi:hypothetical protein
MAVVVELCKNLVGDMHYDMRVNYVINWYGESPEKAYGCMAVPLGRYICVLLTR